jgi:hypothetical protein
MSADRPYADLVSSLAAKAPSKVRVRFLGGAGKLNSVSMLASRVHKGLAMLDPRSVESEVLLLPRDTFHVRVPFLHQRRWEPFIAGVDIVVVVKSSLFPGFEIAAPRLRALCRRRNILLVSSPADGVEATGSKARDVFSESIADFVIADSAFHRDLMSERRDPSTVFYIPPATRPVTGRSLEIRESVKTVIWENPPHHDPNFKPIRNGDSLADYRAFEARIAAFCRDHGAELRTFGVWRDDQTDEGWEDLLLSADIAIECKSIGRRYTRYQLSKPATKLQNYMALGMPAVCDSLPAYVEVGKPAGVRFADSIEEWEHQLGQLFKSRETRLEMSIAARQAVAPLSVRAIGERYAACFAQMLDRPGRVGATQPDTGRLAHQT